MRRIGFLVLALVLSFSFTATRASAQNVVVSHDEWMTGTANFGANEQLFVQNSLGWFGLSGGTILLHSANPFLINISFQNFLTGLGYGVTVSSGAVAFGGFDAVFSEGLSTLNGGALATYASGGGNVFYFGGTGAGGATVEANYSNTFLNGVGLNFVGGSYNGIGTVNTSGFAAQGPYGASLFTGVSSVFGNNGSTITETAATGWSTQLFTHTNGAGVYAAATMVSVPEPGAFLLLVPALFGLGIVAWRRKEEGVAA